MLGFVVVVVAFFFFFSRKLLSLELKDQASQTLCYWWIVESAKRLDTQSIA